jgi:hypothetical protein
MFSGQVIEPKTLRGCWDCVVLSYEFWRARYGGREANSVEISGKRHTVAAVLEKRFWFLSRNVAVWKLAPVAEWRESAERTGAVVRLRRDVTVRDAQAEMQAITEGYGVNPWDALVEISPLQARVRSVFGSFGLALGLAMVMTVATMRPRMPSWNWPAASFFAAKAALGLLAVLIAGLEFTRAAAITMIGGTDMLTEPLSTWLFLMGSIGALSWCVSDQRRRCRVCLRRLGLAAHVGCSGSLLLNWAGTELVCIEGHGMLHVPELAASWHEPERWTSLDESWTGLFARR